MKLTGLTIVILLFILSSLLSASISSDLDRSFNTSLPMWPGLLVYLLITFCYKKNSDVLLTFFSLIVISNAISIYLLYHAINNINLSAIDLILTQNNVLIDVPNDVSLCALYVPLFFALLDSSQIKSKAPLKIVGFLLVLVTCTVYKSFVGIICLFSSMTFYLLLARNKFQLLALYLSVSICLLVDLATGSFLIEKISKTIDLYGWDPRFALWGAALLMFFQLPVLGHGPGTFVTMYQEYIDVLNIPPNLPLDTRLVPWPHNLYLEILAERGVIGFFLFSIILIISIHYSYKIFTFSSMKYKIVVIGLLSSLLGFIIGSFIEFTFLRLWVVNYLFLVVGMISFLYLNFLQGEVKDYAD